eukprot:9143732-Pyramimonas_sp.AAC.2
MQSSTKSHHAHRHATRICARDVYHRVIGNGARCTARTPARGVSETEQIGKPCAGAHAGSLCGT